MLTGRLFSCKFALRTHAGLQLSLGAGLALVLAACSDHGAVFDATPQVAQPQPAAITAVQPTLTAQAIPQQPQLRLSPATLDVAIRSELPKFRPSITAEKIEIQPAGTLEEAPAQLSPWCRYLSEDAAAEAAILRSPTLSGSLDDKKKGSLDLGLSASSFMKADLIQRAAREKCQRYLAELGLQKLVFVSPQGLTAAGYRAKANVIKSYQGELARLRRIIAKELADGNLDAQKATALAVMIDQINADGNAARSQADRRLVDGLKDTEGAKALGAQLLKSETELERINSKMRTLDAVDLSLSAGWRDSDLSDGASFKHDAFRGGVTFSVKLGALSPERFAHERKAREAKIAAIQDQEGGALWQVQALRLSSEKALDGLQESRAKLADALVEAESLLNNLKSVNNPDFLNPKLASQIEMIRLRADKAAVDGSIAEIGNIIKRLKMG